MAISRIYVVYVDGKVLSLVRASSQAQAIRHCTSNRFEAIVANQDHLVQLLGDGIKVEDARAAPEPTGP